MSATDPTEPAPPRLTVFGVFVRFLRFGVLAFGGPVAQIGMLRHELIDREHWTTPERFLRALAIYQALPGPEAHEMCCWLGHLARGRLGSLAAGLGFMLPGFVLMLAAAWLYTSYGMQSPAVRAALAGMQAVAVALVVRAVPRIGARALRPRLSWLPALAGLLSGLADLPFVVPLVFGAVWLPIAQQGRVLRVAVGLAFAAMAAWLWAYPAASDVVANAHTSGESATTLAMLGLGLQAGLLTFGGAYTAIPFVRETAVAQHGWLSPNQFLDGIAIGSVLPAPLVIFGTFAGYVAAGLPGALAMTLGIFAPSFAFPWIGHAALERLMHARRIHSALDGIAASVTGLIAATACQLAAPLTQSPSAAALAVAALAATLRWPSPWCTPLLMACGAAWGWLVG